MIKILGNPRMNENDDRKNMFVLNMSFKHKFIHIYTWDEVRYCWKIYFVWHGW